MCQSAWRRLPTFVRFFARAFGIVMIGSFLCTPTKAQVTNVTEDQAPPTPGVGHDYIHMLSETVNPATGAVSIRISAPVPSGRGLNVPFSFTYDSNAALHLTAPFLSNTSGTALRWADNIDYLAGAGWGYGVPLLTTQQNVQSFTTTGFPTITFNCYYWVDYMLSDLAGMSHALYISPIQPTNTEQCQYETGNSPPNPHNFLTGGDDFVKATVQSMTGSSAPRATVADADGTVYSFSTFSSCFGCTAYSSLPDWIEDRNGNKVVFSRGSSAGSFTVTDTLGRTLLSASGLGNTGDTVSVSGLSTPYTVTWGSTNSSFSINSTVTNNEGGGTSCAGVPPIGGTHPVVSGIALPNGQSYQFQYDSATGLLNKIIYPNGGYVRYVWGTSLSAESLLYPANPYNSSNSNDGCQVIYDAIAVSQRFVSFDGTHEVQEQDFTYATNWNTSTPKTWTSKTTTITTKDLVRGTSFQTQYTYGPKVVPQQPNDLFIPGESGVPVETQIVYSDFTGAPLQTVKKTWNDQYLLASQQTILNNGKTSETTYTYGAGGQLTEKDDYDFGPTLTRKSLTTYQTFGATPLYPGSTSPLLDRPCKSVIENSTGSLVAETDYFYDGGSTVCGTAAGTPSTQSATTPSGTHDETNYAPSSSTPRGNVTKTSRKCLYGCSQNAATTYTYDEAGQVLSKVDPCGNTTCGDMTASSHTTSYGYTDNFSGCGGSAPPSGNTDAYLTSITNPLGQVHSFCYGYDDGQLRSTTDPNNQKTTYTYADNLRRLTETDYPDTGQTTITYNDSVPSISTYKKLSSSQSLCATSILDGLGHVTQTQVTSDPVGTDYAVTSYDGLGHLDTTTNPYRSTSDPTYGVTQYIYDALGRTCLVVPPGGTLPNPQVCPTSDPSGDVLTLYTDSSTEIIDEGNGTKGIQRISQTDGLGRLISACEITGANQLGNSGTPGSCGADITATGFKTTYAYNLLDDLTSVTQAGLNTRSFTYDSLSRLASATNPESGATTYTYDANGNVSTKKDARSITTTYGYDALNRVLSKSYSDGTTPSASYTYDVSSEGGFTLTNPVGRLVMESADNGHATEIFSYDPMGRVTNNYQCTPYNCGSGFYLLSYTYDLIGDMLTSTNGAGVTFTQIFDAAAHLTSLTSSLSDSNHPGTLLSNASYDALGSPLTDSLGNGVAEARGYMNRGWLNSLSANAGGTLTKATGSVTISGTEQFHITGSFPNLTTTYDTGNVSVTVDSFTATVPYGQNSTDSSIASTLAQALTGSLVTATSSGGTVTITSNVAGAGGNYPLSASSMTNDPGGFFVRPSFTGNSGSSLTGGGESGGTVVYSLNIPASGGYAPNGDILSANDSVNGNWTYTYDDFNRLAAANGPGQAYTYGYDRFGNRWNQEFSGSCTSGSAVCLTFDANNHINNGIQKYDLAGNVINDGFHAYAYDAENRITQVDGGSTATYAYDAEGQRVERVTSSLTLDYVYDLAANAVAAFNKSTGGWWIGEVFAGGRHLATYTNNTTYFDHADWLGTERVRTAVNGTLCETITSLPFGDGQSTSGSCLDVSPLHFTGKLRDTESNLDYFGARYNSSNLGRFMSPDWSAKIEPVPYSKLESPQTLNLYSYVRNNPLTYTDPDGHACIPAVNSWSGFCHRATEYGKIDASAKIRAQTRFFAAASAVSQGLANVAPFPSRIYVSGQTATFLEGVGKDLEKMNLKEAAAIASGSLGGPNLDSRMVHAEQTEVQHQLDDLKSSSPDKYNAAIKEINAALNPKAGTFQNALSNIAPTDKAYNQVLDEVRKELGRDIDFSKQSDREAIGNALIAHIRATGGCDVAGNRVAGCH